MGEIFLVAMPKPEDVGVCSEFCLKWLSFANCAQSDLHFPTLQVGLLIAVLVSTLFSAGWVCSLHG